MTSWRDREAADPALAQYIANRILAEATRLGIAERAAQVQLEQMRGVVAELKKKNEELQKLLGSTASGASRRPPSTSKRRS